MKLLQNKKGLILGAVDERSLAWHVAQQCLEAGAQLVLSNTEKAVQLGTLGELAARHDLPIVVCDMTQQEDVQHLLEEAQRLMGGKLDFVLHAVAQSQNLRRHRDYTDVSYNYFLQTVDASALSLHRLLQEAMKQDALAQGASVVTLSYLAAERFLTGYNDMADAKAMLESVVRQMGALYGEKCGVRVNAISQSATPTKAANGWDELQRFYQYTDALSPLGNADAESCAGLCVALFSDLMRSVTMQTIYNDGGFGRTMLTEKMKDLFRRNEKL